MTVNIGDGGETTGQPFSFLYHNSIVQTLYFPEEIDLPGRTITGLTYFNAFEADFDDRVIKIWLGETNAADLSDGWMDGS